MKPGDESDDGDALAFVERRAGHMVLVTLPTGLAVDWRDHPHDAGES